jgi:glutaredoxin 3
MTNVVIYTKDWCGYCQAAKRLLTQLGYQYQEIDVTHDLARYEEMKKKADGRRTVPQVFFDGTGIGGYTELAALAEQDKLPKNAG